MVHVTADDEPKGDEEAAGRGQGVAFRGKEFDTVVGGRTSGSCIKHIGLVIKETFKLYSPATILVPRGSTGA